MSPLRLVVLSVRIVWSSGTFYRQINNPTIMASQEVGFLALLSQRLFYNAWLTTATAGRIDTGGIVLFICSTKMHEFGSKVMCETTFTATQCRALSRWVWFKMAEKNESKEDLEPMVIMLTVKGKLMIFFWLWHKKDWECSGWALMNFTLGFTTYASGKTATFLFFSAANCQRRAGKGLASCNFWRQRSETFFNHPVVP